MQRPAEAAGPVLALAAPRELTIRPPSRNGSRLHDRPHPDAPPSSRFWLYAPFVLLAAAGRRLVRLLVLRARARDRGRRHRAARARSSAGGHGPAATGRSAAFRSASRSAAPRSTLTSTRWGEAVRVETGPSLAVGQIYSPGLVIVQIDGPAARHPTRGPQASISTGRRLEASLALSREPRAAGAGRLGAEREP